MQIIVTSVGITTSHRAKLTPNTEMVQSLEVLKFSSLELCDYVEAQLLENPFLERAELESSPRLPAEVATSEPEKSRERGTDQVQNHTLGEDGGGRIQGSTAVYSGQPVDFFDERVSLFNHLISQIRLNIRDDLEASAATHIAALLDENGYLRPPIERVAKKLGCNVKLARRALASLQMCDPPGIAARSLEECFRLQLEDRKMLNPAMEILLANLEMLSEGKADQVVRACEVDSEEFSRMIKILRKLDPKPARRFDINHETHIIPDVILQFDQLGTFDIKLSQFALPRVLVNRTYHAEVATKVTSKDDRKFVTDCLASANWLVRSLDQRANTILQVVTEIVARQKQFFLHGSQKVQPLTRKEVASAVGKHESTVSRAIANKFIQCPHGVFSLRHFFSSSVGSTKGQGSISATSVQYRLRLLVRDETVQSILSDDDLVDLLRADGIDIARRTVSKYRSKIGIPPSAVRRKSLLTGAVLRS